MATSINEYNVFKITEAHLKKELHKDIFDRVSANLIKEFLDRVTPRIHEMVKSEVSKVVIHGAEGMRNMMAMRDELHVYLSWKGEDPKLTVVGDK